MSDARLPINHGDTGKVSRDKINDSFNDLVTTVEGYRPHIESGYWWIGDTNTGVKAVGDNVEMKVEDGYIRYKSSSVNNWTQIIAIEDLKGDKGDTGDAATVCVGNVSTGDPGTDVCVTNSGTQYAAVLNFTIPRGATGCQGDTGASICAATFCGDDMVFTKDDSCQVVLCDAKDELKGDTGRAATVAVGCVTTGEPGTSVCIVNTGTCCDAILDFTIPQGVKGDRGNAATITVGNTCTGEPGTCACVTNSGTCCDAVLNFIVPQGLKGDTGDTGARIVSAEFSGDDITFTEDNCCTFILCDAKVCLKGDKGDTGDTGARIVSAEFNENDIVFTEDNSCTVTLCNAKTCLKGDKGDTGNAATITVGTTCTGGAGTSASVVNTGTSCDAIFDFTIPKGDQGDKGETGASIVSAAFSSDDIVFTKDDSCTVTLCDAKNELKGDKGDTGDTGARIVSAAFSGNDIVFTEDNSCTVTLEDAKTCLKGDKGDTGTAATITVGTTSSGAAGTAACVTNTGTECAAVFNFVIPTGATGATGNGISCTTCTKNGKTTTVTTYYTNGTCSVFTVNDGEDGQGSGDMLACVYDPNNVGGDAFDYCNFIHTPTIPTDNCELANSCGYTTCTGTLVASDLTPYAKTCTLCAVATSGKYCDLSGRVTDNCQIANSCGFTTCTGTLVASDLNSYAKCCDIPTDNCQLSNSCGYITKAVNDLTNYYLKCETYQKCEVDNLIANFGGFEKVSTLPTTNIKTNVIYLLGPIGTGADKYEEYIYSNNTWVLIGETSVDLTNYAKCCDIPTNNNQLTNGCGYTTCTGTVVASDLTPYAKTCNLCTVSTTGKYCDLTGQPTKVSCFTNDCGYITGITCANVTTALGYTPYDSTNPNGYTTCTGTLVASDLTPYAKSCTLCTVATSGKYCDLSGRVTDNCQIGNSCGYTTCTGTLSTCSDVISALGYTPYNSNNPSGYTTCTGTLSTCSDITTALGFPPYSASNPSGYTTCTGTLVASDIECLAQCCDIPTDNCQLSNSCGYTTCTGTLTAETVVSGDSGVTYTIKVSNSAPSGASSTTITLVP